MRPKLESDIWAQARLWFTSQGFAVHAEVPSHGCRIDLVAYNGTRLEAAEMKRSLTQHVIKQALINQLFADLSWCITPPAKTKYHQTIQRHGIGLLEWSPTGLHVVIPAQVQLNSKITLSKYRQEMIAFITGNSSEDEIGGIAVLPGRGPAQDCARRIIKYAKGNPSCTWKSIYANVPNHYVNVASLRCAMQTRFGMNLKNLKLTKSELPDSINLSAEGAKLLKEVGEEQNLAEANLPVEYEEEPARPEGCISDDDILDCSFDTNTGDLK